jgi:tyrosyl-tRNA synthetase
VLYHPLVAATDSAEDVKRKIKKAYCPPEVVEKNPIMDYAKHIIFGYHGKMTVPSQAVRLLHCVC